MSDPKFCFINIDEICSFSSHQKLLSNNYPPAKRAVLISPYKDNLPLYSLKGPYSFGPCQKYFEDIPFYDQLEFEISIGGHFHSREQVRHLPVLDAFKTSDILEETQNTFHLFVLLKRSQHYDP